MAHIDFKLKKIVNGESTLRMRFYKPFKNFSQLQILEFAKKTNMPEHVPKNMEELNNLILDSESD